ncbi:MAG: amidohydrolase family protein [Pseudonocardiaceae bacterium]|nr:amidohydrolase family protein [Pseudonocardiaceae bacterium]
MGRIDTHHHIIPPEYRRWLQRRGYDAGRPLPDWSVPGSLAVMDELGIDRAVTSVSRPGVTLGDGSDAPQVARQVNEFCAELAKDRPDRFGFFASLPLPDVAASLVELEYALDALGASGAVVLTNVDGHYLDPVRYEPLFAELHRRGSVLFIHPTHPPGPLVDGVPPMIADFLLDTVRAACKLAQAHVMSTYHQARFLLSHGGGFLPYAVDRLASLLAYVGPDDETRHTVEAELSRCYYDIALTGTRALPSLLSVAGPDRIVFGSDFPFAPSPLPQEFAAAFDTDTSLGDELRRKINRDNATALLGDRPGSRPHAAVLDQEG